MRIVFMGTPDFSVPTLERIIHTHHEVLAVVTQPDKPKGRGKTMEFSPVKEKALQHGIPVLQPVKLKEASFLDELRKLEPEVIVVVAFGQILPKEVLGLPPYGCINVHGSLLPKLRGAAPIQWSVINGDKEAGVTTMFMDAGIDTGDMLLKKSITLDPKETGGSLFDKLAVIGSDLLVETLEKLKNGTLIRIPQEDSESTYVKVLNKAMGKIDFSKPAIEIERLIRGLNPWPSAYTYLNGKTLKIWDGDVIEQESVGEVGEIVKVSKDSFAIQTGKDLLVVKDLQLEGKKRMSVEAFLRGYSLIEGSKLEE